MKGPEESTVTTDTRHLVWIAATSWDGVPGTDRAMAEQMTRYARVLWVDPPVSAVTPARRRGDIGGGILPSLSLAGDGITRLTPVALPGLTRPGVRATTAPLLRAQIRWALRRLRVRPAAVVACYLEDVLGRWDGAVSVAYITDDHVAGAGLMGLSAGRLRAQERQVAARADVVAVVSPQLAGHWSALGADPALIPNGCRPGAAGEVAPAPGAAGLPRPVAGLVGQLTERISLPLLGAAADAGFSLLLVGPYDRRWEPQGFAALIARPNVHYAGRVPASEVPSYLAAMDVGLTPYADTPFNQASFPLKTLEYLSAGLPVVSTDLPGARWLRDDLARSDPAAVPQLMALTSDEAGFVAALRRLTTGPHAAAPSAAPAAAKAGRTRAAAAGTGRPKAGRARAGSASAADGRAARAASARAFAARHTWERRAEVLAAAIGLRAPQPSVHGGAQVRA
jgi:teichuronic acid biosynthesis glycosyltransferase TuaH